MPAILGSVVVHALVVLLLLWRPSDADPKPPEPAISIDLVREPAKSESNPPPAEAPKPIPNLQDSALAESSRPADSMMPVKPEARAKPTASERDRVLAQILRHWKPPPELAGFIDAEFQVQVTVLEDGTLAAPFNVRSAYDPGSAIDGWNTLHPDDPSRRGGESFYRALRQAQPLRLNAALAAKAPFPVVLDFRVRDVR